MPTRLQCLLCALLLTLTLAGCENSIDPYSDRGLYSVYGVLELTQHEQWVRVKSLSTPLSKDTTKLNATVTLKNLQTGTTTRLQDSVITFRDGNATVPTHNFLAKQSVDPGTKYRLTVERNDGTTVRATTLTPTGKEANVNPLRGHCQDVFKVTFEDAKAARLVRASLIFFLEGKNGNGIRWEINRSETIYQKQNGNVILIFQPSKVLREELEVEPPEADTPTCTFAPRCWKLARPYFIVHYTYLGPKWYGEIPDDSLVFDPKVSQDITNGLGFFGSVRRNRVSVKLDTCHPLPSTSFRCPDVDLDTLDLPPCGNCTQNAAPQAAHSLHSPHPPNEGNSP